MGRSDILVMSGRPVVALLGGFGASLLVFTSPSTMRHPRRPDKARDFRW